MELLTPPIIMDGYPSSDDVIVTSPTASWALEITHEETVRFFRLDNAKHRESAV